MDRFFSKLDLRDIKIKPEGSRFLPDEEDGSSLDEALAVSVEDAPVALNDDFGSVPYEAREPRAQMATATYAPPDAESWRTATAVIQSPATCQAPHRDGHTEVLKVSAKSRPSAVAGAIAGVVRESGRAEVQAIGAGATNQAIKAIAIAREYLLETEIDAVCVPAFIDVTIDDEERTAIRLVVEKR